MGRLWDEMVIYGMVACLASYNVICTEKGTGGKNGVKKKRLGFSGLTQDTSKEYYVHDGQIVLSVTSGTRPVLVTTQGSYSMSQTHGETEKMPYEGQADDIEHL